MLACICARTVRPIECPYSYQVKVHLLVCALYVGITVTLKTAWSKDPYVKKVGLVCKEDDVEFVSVESISDPRPAKVRFLTC